MTRPQLCWSHLFPGLLHRNAWFPHVCSALLWSFSLGWRCTRSHTLAKSFLTIKVRMCIACCVDPFLAHRAGALKDCWFACYYLVAGRSAAAVEAPL